MGDNGPLLVEQHPLLGQGQVSLQGVGPTLLPPVDESGRSPGGPHCRLFRARAGR